MKKCILKIFKFLPVLVFAFCLSAPALSLAAESSSPVTSHKEFKENTNIFDSFAKTAGKVYDVVKGCVTGENCVKKALETSGEVIADALGLDTDTHCSEPVEKHTCLFCPMFHIFFNASSSVARASYGKFHKDLGQLVLIFLAVSLALVILKNVASMGARDPGTLMNELITKGFVCIVIYLIITQDYFNVFNLTITPIIQDALSIVNESDKCSAHEAWGLVNHSGAPMGYKHTAGALESTMSSVREGAVNTLDGVVMPVDLDYMIVCTIDTIERKIYMLFEFGEWAFCRGLGPDRIFYIIPHPIMLIDGIILYIGGLFYLIAYPWILADAVLQLGISLALLPFAVAGFAFSGTKKYLPKVFNWILHSMFVFIFMSILIRIVLGYASGELVELFSRATDPLEFFTNPVKGIAFYGGNMIRICFILAIGWIYMPLVRDLAGNFSKGTSLTPAAKVGTVATDSVEKVVQKTGNYTAKVATQGAVSSAQSLSRRFRSVDRHLALGLAQRFGHVNGGNKEFSVAGMKFISEKDGVTGKSILRREFTSITGRKHVMLSDKLCTIKEEYSSSGVLIKREVKFKYDSFRKGLVDKDGNVDMETLNFLLNSKIGRNYRQAVMEQVAVDVLKAKGKRVGVYYNSRNVTYNPSNPTEIQIEQIDHSGKVTRFGLNIDARTGQTAVSYMQDVTKTDPIHRSERKARIWMHRLFLRKFGSISRRHGGSLTIRTFLGTRYDLKRDPITRKLYYVRTRRKYWLFGPQIEKSFYDDRTQVRVLNSSSKQAKDLQRVAKISHILGGKTRHKGFLFVYEARTDRHGNTIYSRHLRPGYNIKNYSRIIRSTSRLLLKTPGYMLKISSYPLIHPTKTIKGIIHPVRSYKNIALSLKTELSGIYANSWQTGNIYNYSVNGSNVVNSSTGQTVKTRFNDEVFVKGIDGSKSVIDNTTGTTVNYYNSRKIRRDFFFDNGVFSLQTKAQIASDGSVVDEKTKFQYSQRAQQGHDSILSPVDGHQVVESNGHIASDLTGATNPLNLEFGLDNVAGMTAVGSKVIKDFIVQDILAEGRKRRVNAMRTNYTVALR